MAKIRLDLEALEIESFDTTDAHAEGRGTVRGHMTERVTICQDSCEGTCYTHCWGGDCDSDGPHGPTEGYCTMMGDCDHQPLSEVC